MRTWKPIVSSYYYLFIYLLLRQMVWYDTKNMSVKLTEITTDVA